MGATDLQIHINDFDGPLELLLHLIRQSKMDIYDIDIKDITEQYFNYLNKMREANFDIAGDFFVMAANLMRIKSKMLLAKETETDEDDDPRDDLVSQLIEYKRFKKAANRLHQEELVRNEFHSRSRGRSTDDVQIEDDEFELSLLQEAWEKIMRRRKLTAEPQIQEIKEWDFSVPEQSERMEQKIMQSKNHQIGFSKLLDINASIEELITDFLALLEMVKHKAIRVSQASENSDILIKGCK